MLVTMVHEPTTPLVFSEWFMSPSWINFLIRKNELNIETEDNREYSKRMVKWKATRCIIRKGYKKGLSNKNSLLFLLQNPL